MEDFTPETARGSNEHLHQMVIGQLRDVVSPHLQPFMEAVRSPRVLVGAKLQFEVGEHTKVAVTLGSLEGSQPTSFVLDSETRLQENVSVQKTVTVHESSKDHPSYNGLVELNNARAIAGLLHNKQTRLSRLELVPPTAQPHATSALGQTALR